jgi:DNA-binding NarL/FixJ family response regulator
MNGIEATTIIKKSRQETAIIGLCVDHDSYTIEAFLKAGGLAVVSKARLEDLRSMIQRACASLQEIDDYLRIPLKLNRREPLKEDERNTIRVLS